MITEAQIAKLNKIAHAYFVDRAACITKWEGEFAADVYKRYERFGNKTFVSDKQAACIDKIVAKLA